MDPYACVRRTLTQEIRKLSGSALVKCFKYKYRKTQTARSVLGIAALVDATIKGAYKLLHLAQEFILLSCIVNVRKIHFFYKLRNFLRIDSEKR